MMFPGLKNLICMRGPGNDFWIGGADTAKKVFVCFFVFFCNRRQPIVAQLPKKLMSDWW